jgi:DeoR family galactitol utilization operon repressor
MDPNLSEREKRIIDLLAENASVSASSMAETLGVSAVTVRSDLRSLSRKGYVLRTRGGATAAFHPAILARREERSAEKMRIAKEAASLVSNGDTVMIEAGTTTALVARYLLGKRDVRVVTNSTLVLPYARTNPGIDLTLLGGEFRPFAESVVGPIALSQLETFQVRLAFVGTDGFSAERGLTTNMVEGAEVVKKMARLAQTTVLCADSAKYGKRGFVSVLPLSGIRRLVTDTGLEDRQAAAIEGLGVEVVRV